MELNERYKLLSTKLCWGPGARATDLRPFYTLSYLVGTAGHLDEPKGLKLAR